MQLIERYKGIRNYTNKIFKPLQIEDYVPQPIAIVSPPKWNLGHTTWFFETFLLLNYSKKYKIFDERYPFLFNSYYNNAGDRVFRHKRGDLTRPTVEEVYEYRKYVNDAMINFIDSGINSEIEDLIDDGGYVTGKRRPISS